MIERPERQIAEFARAGADLITVHAEATPHIDYALSLIRDGGLAAGLAVCPSTPLGVYAEVADKVDLALCMTVNPGWGGQSFIEASIGRLGRARGHRGFSGLGHDLLRHGPAGDPGRGRVRRQQTNWVST